MPAPQPSPRENRNSSSSAKGQPIAPQGKKPVGAPAAKPATASKILTIPQTAAKVETEVRKMNFKFEAVTTPQLDRVLYNRFVKFAKNSEVLSEFLAEIQNKAVQKSSSTSTPVIDLLRSRVCTVERGNELKLLAKFLRELAQDSFFDKVAKFFKKNRPDTPLQKLAWELEAAIGMTLKELGKNN